MSLQQCLGRHPLDGPVLVVAEAVVVVREQVARETVVCHFQSQFLVNSVWGNLADFDQIVSVSSVSKYLLKKSTCPKTGFQKIL